MGTQFDLSDQWPDHSIFIARHGELPFSFAHPLEGMAKPLEFSVLDGVDSRLVICIGLANEGACYIC